MPVPTGENYSKALFHLSEKNGEAGIPELAQAPGISRPTANGMVKNPDPISESQPKGHIRCGSQRVSRHFLQLDRTVVLFIDYLEQPVVSVQDVSLAIEVLN